MANLEAKSPISTGTLVLVVGPSGAGKDALLASGRAAFAHDARFVFPRRIITRAGDDSSESHDAISPEAFEIAESAHEFLLSWRAHGLGYAIPGSAKAALTNEKVVIVNVSRASIDAAERLVERVVVIHVTAPVEILAQRIAARQREPESEIAARLKRQVHLAVSRATVIEINNAGKLEEASRHFIAALKNLALREADGG